MIKFQRITTSDKELYQFMEQLMVESFPPEEYRTLEELREYTDKKGHFYNNVVLENEIPIGLLTYWQLDGFYYFEHFAISPKHRNCGIGQRTLRQLCQELPLPIILEVELPNEEMAQRRIHFYERQDFKLWNKDYLQPPYKKGDNYLPLLLMAYGNLNPDTDYERIKKAIYKEVYNAE